MENRKKIVTAHNYVRKGFISHKPSCTVPGQVLPMRTVLDRFRRGQGIQSFSGVYNPDIPPGIENLNKIDRIEAARAQANKVAQIRKALADKNKRDQETPAPEPPPTVQQ